jgi:hypothetical protein
MKTSRVKEIINENYDTSNFNPTYVNMQGKNTSNRCGWGKNQAHVNDNFNTTHNKRMKSPLRKKRSSNGHPGTPKDLERSNSPEHSYELIDQGKMTDLRINHSRNSLIKPQNEISNQRIQNK